VGVFIRQICALFKIIQASVGLHHFFRTREKLFCEGAENYAENQSSLILKEDDGRQRLSRSQRLRNKISSFIDLSLLSSKQMNH
jgi:hypothetical protein